MVFQEFLAKNKSKKPIQVHACYGAHCLIILGMMHTVLLALISGHLITGKI